MVNFIRALNSLISLTIDSKNKTKNVLLTSAHKHTHKHKRTRTVTNSLSDNRALPQCVHELAFKKLESESRSRRSCEGGTELEKLSRKRGRNRREKRTEGKGSVQQEKGDGGEAKEEGKSKRDEAKVLCLLECTLQSCSSVSIMKT